MPPSDLIERLDVSEWFEVLGAAPCPTEGCGGTGTRVRVGSSRQVHPCAACLKRYREEELRAERAEVVAGLLVRAGLNPRFEGWSLGTYPADRPGSEALAVAREWIEGYEAASPANLVLFGEVGSGKTGLAWGIVRELVERSLVRSRFVVFHELLDEMRESFRSKRPFDTTSNIGRVSLLALDDLGAERPTPFACSELLGLVDLRWRRNLPTIFTSNYDPNELAARLGHEDPVVGERIVSRMVDGATQHRLKAADRRTKG